MIRSRRIQNRKRREERINHIFIHEYFLFLQTPLHWVSMKGSVECVNVLIQHGADIEVKTVRSESV